MADLPAESGNKRLNNLVAITVVILSVATGLGNIKDGNIVQNMQQAKSDAVDRWSQYQADRLKLHLSEAARDQLAAIASATPAAGAQAEPALRRLTASIAKYEAEAPQLRASASGLDREYDALNVHDDQFDASEASLSIAVSVAAVASLVDALWVLGLAWMFGVAGLLFEIAGFAGWSLHPDFLARLLG